MDPAAAKQQIAERVKQANNFLVTVNANPTVDQLAACIGLTLLLNKMGKHATAVFSGKIPNVIEFLEPDKTIQKNADMLRDFIISLDKNKADKLRYKVENEVVKIFITPYKTALSENDFVFSEGDYNVEVVMALGVSQRAQLDVAITAHGRILHDATIITFNAGAVKAQDAGQINWADPGASSLSEMLVSISESFGTGLIDAQSATAFLTGIVAETGRFSNKKTTPKVMTMSAQLMAAGANQQLIVSKLEPPAPPNMPQLKIPKGPAPLPSGGKPEGVMDVPHDDKKIPGAAPSAMTTEIHIDEHGNIRTADMPDDPELREVAAQLPVAPPAAAPLPPLSPLAAQPLVPVAPADPAPSTHAFMSAPPLNETPAGMGGAPDVPAGFDLSPSDPFSEENPQDAPPDQIAHVPDVVPPGVEHVDQARNAVDSALAAAPFDPATAGPVESLNAEPLSSEPLHEEPAPKPPVPSSDTPSLVLPSDPLAPLTTTASEPARPEPFSEEPEMAAPPPVPPPLVAGPGAVIPPPHY